MNGSARQSFSYTELLTPSGQIDASENLGDWPYVIAFVFVATVVWYAVRSRPIRFRWFGGVLIGGLLALVVALVIGGEMTSHGDGRELLGTVCLLFAVLGAGAAAWVYFRLGRGRRPATVIALFFLPLAAYGGVVSVVPVPENPLLAGMGLLALAWIERSVLLASVTVVFLLAAVLFTIGTTALLIPAAVVLAGAIAALAAYRPPALDGRPDTP